MQPATMEPHTTVERFTGLDPGDFRGAIEEIWNAAGGALKNTVVDLVENGIIQPVQGLGLMSCVAGQLLGYETFHGQRNGTDLLATLAPRRER